MTINTLQPTYRLMVNKLTLAVAVVAFIMTAALGTVLSVKLLPKQPDQTTTPA